jgi:hypothetical protein
MPEEGSEVTRKLNLRGGCGNDTASELRIDLFAALCIADSDFDEAIADTPNMIGSRTFRIEGKIGLLVEMVPEINANVPSAHGCPGSLCLLNRKVFTAGGFSRVAAEQKHT